MRLSPQTRPPAGVATPLYAREEHRLGIVHFGIGAFHRAHQAVFTDDALNGGDRDFLIRGVSMRSAKVAEELNPQHGLYSVTQREGSARKTRIIGAVDGVLVAPEGPAPIVEALSLPSVAVVTFTITEKGYRRGEDGQFPAFCDLLARSFAERRRQGLGGVTLLSCDNLADNGLALFRLIAAHLEQTAPDLALWFAAECACPSSMVDRIVPATAPSDLNMMASTLGARDEGAVLTEPFSQWVIEDRFAGRRPRWELGGAQIVTDVRPYETAKLRMLNGAHSALAYLGLKRSLRYVHQAIADRELLALVERLMRIEAASSITPAPGQDLNAYADALLARFRNAALGHELMQIAMDGSQKIPQRWLETLAFHQARGQACPALIKALAAWIEHVRGDKRPVDDPMAEPLAELWKRCGREEVAAALFGDKGLLAARWTASPESLAELTAKLPR